MSRFRFRVVEPGTRSIPVMPGACDALVPAMPWCVGTHPTDSPLVNWLLAVVRGLLLLVVVMIVLVWLLAAVRGLLLLLPLLLVVVVDIVILRQGGTSSSIL